MKAGPSVRTVCTASARVQSGERVMSALHPCTRVSTFFNGTPEKRQDALLLGDVTALQPSIGPCVPVLRTRGSFYALVRPSLPRPEQAPQARRHSRRSESPDLIAGRPRESPEQPRLEVHSVASTLKIHMEAKDDATTLDRRRPHSFAS